MNVIIVLLLGSVSSAPQEDIDRLIEQLSDESVEKREESAEKLIRLGEKSREALRRAGEKGDAEKRFRALNLIKTLDLYAELRPWYALDSRVTLSGDMTLKEAIAEIERQTGQKVAVDAWPEERFRIESRFEPFWSALEKICKSSEKRNLGVGPEGPRLYGTAWVEPFSKISGPFRVSAGSATLRRSFDVTTKSEERTLTLGISVAWERGIEGLRSYLALTAVRDDQGNDVASGFQQYESRIYAGYYPAFLERKRVWVQGFAPTTSRAPLPGVKSVSIDGMITVYIRGAEGDLDLALPPKDGTSGASVDVFNERLEEKSTLQFSLSQFNREKAEVGFRLKIENVDVRLVEDVYNYLYLRDRTGAKYQGTPGAISKPATGRTFELRFAGVPESAELTGLTICLPRRLVRKDISFKFPGIQLP